MRRPPSSIPIPAAGAGLLLLGFACQPPDDDDAIDEFVGTWALQEIRWEDGSMETVDFPVESYEDESGCVVHTGQRIEVSKNRATLEYYALFSECDDPAENVESGYSVYPFDVDGSAGELRIISGGDTLYTCAIDDAAAAVLDCTLVIGPVQDDPPHYVWDRVDD